MSAANGNRHECPVKGCKAMVPDSMLMCAPHWRRVTRKTAIWVYGAYHKHPQSEDHREACKQAIREAEGQS